MLETWIQWTCDGCGQTEYNPIPNETKAQVRAELKKLGWRHYAGDLDYCGRCVSNGVAARRETEMNAYQTTLPG